MEKAVVYNCFYFFFFFFFFFGHTLTPTVKVCDNKTCIYLDTHFLLNCDAIYLICIYIYIYIPFFSQESVELLGPDEIHMRRIESVNGVLPT